MEVNFAPETIDPQKESWFFKFPKGIQLEIIACMRFKDFSNFQVSCKRAYVVSDDNFIWHKRIYPVLFPGRMMGGLKSYNHEARKECLKLINYKKNMKNNPLKITQSFIKTRLLEGARVWENNKLKKSLIFQKQGEPILHLEKNQWLSLPYNEKGEEMQLCMFEGANTEVLGSGKYILLTSKVSDILHVWDIDSEQLQPLPEKNHVIISSNLKRKAFRIYNFFTKTINNDLLPTLFPQENGKFAINVWNVASQQQQAQLTRIDQAQDFFAFDYQGGEYLTTFHQKENKPAYAIAWNINEGAPYPIPKEALNISAFPTHCSDMINYSSNRRLNDFYFYKDFFVNCISDQGIGIWDIKKNKQLMLLMLPKRLDGWCVTDRFCAAFYTQNIEIWEIAACEQIYHLDATADDVLGVSVNFPLQDESSSLKTKIEEGYLIFTAKNRLSYKLRAGYSYSTKTIFLNLMTGHRSFFTYDWKTPVLDYTISILDSVAAISLTASALSPELFFLDLTTGNILESSVTEENVGIVRKFGNSVVTYNTQLGGKISFLRYLSSF